MTRFQGFSSTLLLFALGCSAASDDDFFKESGATTDAGGTGASNVGVGGASVASTDGGVTTNATSSGAASFSDADASSSTSGSTDGNGGEASTTTMAATTTDGAPATGGSGTGGVGTAGAGTGGAEAGSGGNGGTIGGTGGGGAGGAGAGGSGGTGGCSPSDEVCDGVDNDCDDDVDEGDVCPSGCFGDLYRSRAYLFCDRPPGEGGGNGRTARNWQQAMQYCLDRDQVLVNIQSTGENDFVYEGLNELGGSGDIWIGATDQEDEDLWSWALGTNVASWEPFYDDDTETVLDDLFADWRSGEPNDEGGEDCGLIEVQDGGGYLWDDRDCSTDLARFVCEDAP